MRKKKILKGAGVLLIAALLFFSFEKMEMKKI